jgi:K+-sensing histidine kinase KdpD
VRSLLVESVVDDQTDVGHAVSLVSGEPVVVRADPLSLRRLVVNLVDNALKYGERARLELRSSERQVTLEIDDDGPGIPGALQQRVFEPFFRGDPRSTVTRAASGLALQHCGPSFSITADILSSEIAWKRAENGCLVASHGTIISPTQNFSADDAD